MRQLKYLSPSALSCWEKDQEEFYGKYLAEFKTPRAPQEIYMSVGSSFDAFVKAEMFFRLFGNTNPEYELDNLIDTQVEEHNRDQARKDGEFLMECYRKCGAFEELMSEVERSPIDPEFETTLQEEIHGVKLLGKPDCLYYTPERVPVILDWKVNGFYSKSNTSPAKGYRLVRDCWTAEKQSRNHNVTHKAYEPVEYKDYVHSKNSLEFNNKDWADQLSTYAWLKDIPVASEDFVVRIDQLVGPGAKTGKVRCANHVAKISKEWQEFLMGRYTRCWLWAKDPFDGDEERVKELDDRAKASYVFSDLVTTSGRDNTCKVRVR